MQSAKQKQTNCLGNDYLRAEAVQFLEWCRFNLRDLADSLDQKDKKQFEADKLPNALIVAVETAWLKKLKTSLTPQDHDEAIRKALPARSDYETFMNAPYDRPQELPQSIFDAVAKEHILKQNENYALFLATSGPKRLEAYLPIWQSQAQALTKLITEECAYQKN